jgi:hypothetical protein
MRRTILWVFAITVLHFVGQLGQVMVSFGMAMGRFESGNPRRWLNALLNSQQAS